MSNTRCQPEVSEYVRRVQELRRSSAASPRVTELSRAQANRAAILEQLDELNDALFDVDQELDYLEANNESSNTNLS